MQVINLMETIHLVAWYFLLTSLIEVGIWLILSKISFSNSFLRFWNYYFLVYSIKILTAAWLLIKLLNNFLWLLHVSLHRREGTYYHPIDGDVLWPESRLIERLWLSISTYTVSQINDVLWMITKELKRS